MDGCVLASASPEQFLSVAGSHVITRPIKGTRPRGSTPEEDSLQRRSLYESEKDRAENVMIVDLLRNDLSRVARPHTVKVPRLFEVETHPTVHHLVSEVAAELVAGAGPVDLLRAAFPGGSITGAPKVRAMEIIQELEPHARGFYCGSLGWISFHGGMELSVLIRTMTLSHGWVQLPVGGGVVAKSDPEAEYQETLDKAEGMLRALRPGTGDITPEGPDVVERLGSAASRPEGYNGNCVETR
jgi:para-aminobenzoate synthetase component 1